MTAIAKCHCGATQISLAAAPTEASECNCTYCRRTGALWAYLDPADLPVEASNTQIYSATGLNDHHFCGNCGCNTHGFSPDWASHYNMDGTPKEGVQSGSVPTAKRGAVNVRMIDGLDLDGLTINRLDGLNNW